MPLGDEIKMRKERNLVDFMKEVVSDDEARTVVMSSEALQSPSVGRGP